MEYFNNIKNLEDTYPKILESFVEKEANIKNAMIEFHKLKEGSLKELEEKEDKLNIKEEELEKFANKISEIYNKFGKTKIANKEELVNVEELLKEKHKFLKEKEDNILNKELELKVKGIELDKMRKLLNTCNNIYNSKDQLKTPRETDLTIKKETIKNNTNEIQSSVQ